MAMTNPNAEPEIDPTDPESVINFVARQAKEQAKAQPKPEPGRLLLKRDAPLDNAREFARHCCHRNGTSEVWFWGDQFWRWNGQFYAPWGKEQIRGQVWDFLDGAYRLDKDGESIPFRPNRHNVDELLDALRSCLAQGPEHTPPMWIDDDNNGVPAPDWVVFRNCIVNVVTGRRRPLTHRLWTQSGFQFDWDPNAPCPTWDKFLKDVFGDDERSVNFLEEFMGYCMTGDTRFEKAAMLIGPKRTGKSTIVHLIGKLVGEGAYVGLSFNDWLAGKATQVLIGKRVLAFPDVRQKPGKMWGQNYDPGGIDHRSCELMLKITGRDKVSIPRLYAEAWNGVLSGKIILTSNDVPNFNDTSGVLPTRFIKLQFRRSFAGHEDVNMRTKLAAQLPGIAARCIGAYQRLCKSGAFVQPKSAAELEQAVLEASDPFTVIAKECFEPDYSGLVTNTEAHSRFEQWCKENGRLDIYRSTPPNRFWKRLCEVAGFEHIVEHRPHGQPRGKLGLRLRGSEASGSRGETVDLLDEIVEIIDEAPDPDLPPVPMPPTRR
jgi:putative DNA primase/helicase